MNRTNRENEYGMTVGSNKAERNVVPTTKIKENSIEIGSLERKLN